jgi:Zn-dependent protease with chaperone function
VTRLDAPGGPLPDAASVPAPRHMWWTYLLTLFALAVMGGGAGQALFLSQDLGNISSSLTCYLQHGFSVQDLPRTVAGTVDPHFAGCVASYDRRHGIATLTGAGAVVAAAWLLMVGGGLVLRARLRPEEQLADSSEAARRARSRFEAWCDVWGLAGRGRPRLLLAAPRRFGGRAFTTGVPLARPVVVVPLAYAYLDTEAFDVVVLHELAHVRSRDLLWAASVWWAGWLNVPVLLLLALSSAVAAPYSSLRFYGTSTGIAAVLSAAVLVLRAALLRRRELAADRFAVDVLGDAAPLRAVLGARPTAPAAPAPLTVRARHLVRAALRWGASHPPPEVRARAEPADLERWEGGFAVSAAAGVIAMLTYQGVETLLVDLGDLHWRNPSLPSDLAFATTGLLWACVVVPAWARRVRAAARAGQRPTWAGPLAGAVLGLTGGYLLQAPGAGSAVGRDLFAGHLPLAVLLLVVGTAGAAVVAVGLATSVAGPVPAVRAGDTAPAGRAARAGEALARGPLAGAVLTAAVVLTTALSMTAMLLTSQIRWSSTAEDRTLLLGVGAQHYWPFAPVLVFIGCVLSAPRPAARPPRRPAVRKAPRLPAAPARAHLAAIGAAAVVGGLVAAVDWRSRSAGVRHDQDALYLLLTRGWWICALAGWTVFVLVLAAGGLRRVPARTSAAAPAPVPAGTSGNPPAAAPAGPAALPGPAASPSAAAAIPAEPPPPSPNRATSTSPIDPSTPAGRLPAALAAALLTAALAGLLRALALAVSGPPGTLHLFQESVRAPTWMVLGAAVVTAPPLYAVTRAARRPRRAPGRSQRGLRARTTASAVALGAAVLAVAQISGLLAPLTVSAHDDSRSLAAVRSRAQPSGIPALPAPRPASATTPPPAGGTPAPPAPDPGRALTRAEAGQVFTGLRALLPKGWKPAAAAPHSTYPVEPASCRTLSDGDYAGDQAGHRTADISHAYTAPARGTAAGGLTVTFTVTSYAKPFTGFDGLRREVRRCPHYDIAGALTGGARIHVSTSLRDLAGTPYPAVRVDTVSVARTTGIKIVATSVHDTETVGHTQLSAEVVYAYYSVPPSAAVRAYPPALTTAALKALVANVLKQQGS